MDVPADVFLEALVVGVCLCMLVFYTQKRRMKQCGVEVIFVCCMEMFCHMVNIIVGEDQLITMDDGRTVNWLRYSSWLITTPVMLIHLSNLESNEAYDKDSSFKFLTINQCMIVCGMAGSFAAAEAFRYIMFTAGCLFFLWLSILMYPVFCRSYKSYPEKCKPTIEILAVVFYGSWTSFPILWVLGGEGAGTIGFRGSAIGHALADLVSKNLFGYLIWYLRWDKERQLNKSVERKTILRRAASGDIPRVLILGQPKDPFFKRYIADVCTDAGFIADVVHTAPAFGRILADRRSSRTPSTSYSVVIVNAVAVQQILLLEATRRREDTEGGSQRPHVSIRDLIGAVPLIGYTCSTQHLEVDPQAVFDQFQVGQRLVRLKMDQDGSKNEREAFKFIIEAAVDERLDTMASTNTHEHTDRHTQDFLSADMRRYNSTGQLRLAVDVDTFKPKHIKVLSPREDLEKGSAGTPNDRKKMKRRQSMIGKILFPGAKKNGDSPANATKTGRPTTTCVENNEENHAPAMQELVGRNRCRRQGRMESGSTGRHQWYGAGSPHKQQQQQQQLHNNGPHSSRPYPFNLSNPSRRRGGANNTHNYKTSMGNSKEASRQQQPRAESKSAAGPGLRIEAAAIKEAVERVLSGQLDANGGFKPNGNANNGGGAGGTPSPPPAACVSGLKSRDANKMLVSEIESYVSRSIQRWRSAKAGDAMRGNVAPTEPQTRGNDGAANGSAHGNTINGNGTSGNTNYGNPGGNSNGSKEAANGVVNGNNGNQAIGWANGINGNKAESWVNGNNGYKANGGVNGNNGNKAKGGVNGNNGNKVKGGVNGNNENKARGGVTGNNGRSASRPVIPKIMYVLNKSGTYTVSSQTSGLKINNKQLNNGNVTANGGTTNGKKVKTDDDDNFDSEYAPAHV